MIKHQRPQTRSDLLQKKNPTPSTTPSLSECVGIWNIEKYTQCVCHVWAQFQGHSRTEQLNVHLSHTPPSLQLSLKPDKEKGKEALMCTTDCITFKCTYHNAELHCAFSQFFQTFEHIDFLTPINSYISPNYNIHYLYSWGKITLVNPISIKDKPETDGCMDVAVLLVGTVQGAEG